MWTNSCNSENKLSTKTKQRFSNFQWTGKHNDTQDLLIRALIYWLSKQLNTCIILLLDFHNLPIVLYCGLCRSMDDYNDPQQQSNNDTTNFISGLSGN